MATTKRAREKRKHRYADTREAIKGQNQTFAPTAFKLPDGVEEFRFRKVGIYKLDIIPYVVGEHNPNKNVEAGDLYYELTYNGHKGIEPNPAAVYPCPRLERGKKCYLCIVRSNTTNTDLDTLLKPKLRQIFLVIDHKERDKGVQIFETAHFKMFGELLKNRLDSGLDPDNPDATGEFDKFWHLDGGMSLKVSVVEDTMPNNNKTYFKPVTIDFFPRPEQYDESLVDDVPNLEDILWIRSYEETKAIMEAAEGEPEDEEAANGKAAKKGGKKKPAAEDEDEEPEEEAEEEEEVEEDDEEAEDDPTAEQLGIKVGSTVKHDEFGTCTVKHVSGDGTALRIEDEDGELHKAVAPSECALVKGKKKKAAEPEDEDEEQPAPKKGGKKKPAAEDEDEEEESEEEADEDEDSVDPFDSEEDEEVEEEEEEDEEPPAKKSAAKKKTGKSRR